jgi:hypothetical protein
LTDFNGLNGELRCRWQGYRRRGRPKASPTTHCNGQFLRQAAASTGGIPAFLKPLQVYGREPHQFLSFVKVRAPVWFNVGVRDQGMDVMQAAGVDRLASRKEWPLEVLKQVLADLMRGVPRSLLERQIWSGSASSWDWWQRQQAHSRSSAVMSMVPPPPPFPFHLTRI